MKIGERNGTHNIDFYEHDAAGRLVAMHLDTYTLHIGKYFTMRDM